MLKLDDPLLFGANTDPGLVAVEHIRQDDQDLMRLFFRRDGQSVALEEHFEPFIVGEAALLQSCLKEACLVPLQGGNPLNMLALFATWDACGAAKDALAKASGASAGSASAPYLFINDPVSQHLLRTGRTLFKELPFESLRRMQVDIECHTTSGYEFCNAEREGDRILAIGVSDQTGWQELIGRPGVPESDLLKRFVAVIHERDPDVLEGHNIFNFDLPYLVERARQCRVKLAIGRDRSPARRRASRFTVADRTMAYDRFDIFGRHVVDTMFLLHIYDVSHRTLESFGLKNAARHFGVAVPGRTYIDGREIAGEFQRDPEKVLRYLADDLGETQALGALLSRSHFLQARMLPFGYQNVCVRGNAAKIDALLLRDYLRRGYALPKPDAPADFEGGYTDIFATGVIRDVEHCDVRSLYPSLMLARRLAPATDPLGSFLKMLQELRDFRLEVKAGMRQKMTGSQRHDAEALQSTFKVLINSFYGYLGFSQARFCDFQAAEAVTRQGRQLLADMIGWLRELNAQPVEIDTDGVYFKPPEKNYDREKFQAAFQSRLPPGIEVEFDGRYRAMFSYKMKNYALLEENGEMIIKGAALKSRGLEPFQRDFMRDAIRCLLEGRDADIGGLKRQYEAAIRDRAWPVERLAKTERLQDSPASYAARQAKGGGARNAVYELALKSGRDYRSGDQISYYVIGTRKTVAVHENARLTSEWDPANRDENTAYYLAKLDALYAKFGKFHSPQGELALN